MSKPSHNTAARASATAHTPVRTVAAANRAPARSSKRTPEPPEKELKRLRAEIADLQTRNSEASDRLSWALDTLNSVIDQMRQPKR